MVVNFSGSGEISGSGINDIVSVLKERDGVIGRRVLMVLGEVVVLVPVELAIAAVGGELGHCSLWY